MDAQSFTGDLGQYYLWTACAQLIAERLPMTIGQWCNILFTWLVALPIGIYSAVKSILSVIISYPCWLSHSQFFLAIILCISGLKISALKGEDSFPEYVLALSWVSLWI